MKMFAINFLTDILGRGINKYLPSHVTAFANFVAYTINREIDLANHLDKYSVESMVKDGIFGYGNGQGYGEHLVPIHLQFREFVDQIEWDICNPDNVPEEFAAGLVSDLGLEPAHEFMMAITYEIKKQITLHCCRKLQHFVSVFENYVAPELEDLDLINQEKEFPPTNILFASSRESKPSDEALKLRHLIAESNVVDETEMIFAQGRFTDKLPQPLKLGETEVPQFLVERQNSQDSEQEERLMMTDIALRHASFVPLKLSPEKEQQLFALKEDTYLEDCVSRNKGLISSDLDLNSPIRKIEVSANSEVQRIEREEPEPSESEDDNDEIQTRMKIKKDGTMVFTKNKTFVPKR